MGALMSGENDGRVINGFELCTPNVSECPVKTIVIIFFDRDVALRKFLHPLHANLNSPVAIARTAF
jgi:hypothetical protein